MRHQYQTGFTLLEMLVVAAILFIFGAIALQSFSGSTAKARDTQRVSDLEQIRIALRLHAEQNGFYPAAQGGAEALGDGAGLTETALVPFLPNMPRDPRHDDGTEFRYIYDRGATCNGQAYYVIYAQTMEVDQNANGSTAGCVGVGDTSNMRIYLVAQRPST
ncbi:MAG TPA: prepilin-type N-terminal cleavage/methylation domain-containing protein [Candidatus Paceibacterota bacterium]|nr:prepilin-type N-terminal cleavage/methylation domain-containing protein [Candidatus Paceibacterota bacterium]